MAPPVAVACVATDVVLEGHRCDEQAVCVAGWRCNRSNWRCVPESADGDAGPDAGDLLFVDEFEAGATSWPDGWATFGSSDWALEPGELVEHFPTATQAFAWVPSLVDLTDYHVEARMRPYGPLAGGDQAMEIAFRIQTSPATALYFCNWEPATGAFLLMRWDVGDLAVVPLDPATLRLVDGGTVDPTAPVTMHVVASGLTIDCWLDEIPDARLTYTDDPDGGLLSGAVGLKTYMLATAFDYIRVSPVR